MRNIKTDLLMVLENLVDVVKLASEVDTFDCDTTSEAAQKKFTGWINCTLNFRFKLEKRKCISCKKYKLLSSDLCAECTIKKYGTLFPWRNR